MDDSDISDPDRDLTASRSTARDTAVKVVDKTQAVVDQVHEALPDQVKPAVSSIIGALRATPRRTTDPKNRAPVVVGVLLLIVVLVLARRRESPD